MSQKNAIYPENAITLNKKIVELHKKLKIDTCTEDDIQMLRTELIGSQKYMLISSEFLFNLTDYIIRNSDKELRRKIHKLQSRINQLGDME